MASMKKVLLHIQAQKPFDDLNFEERRVLKECYDSKYFEGVVLSEMASGKIIARYRYEPRLTLEGLQFLDSINETEDASADDHEKRDGAVKKRFDVTKAFVKRLWALFVGLSVVVTVFGWPYIIRFLKFFVDIFREPS